MAKKKQKNSPNFSVYVKGLPLVNIIIGVNFFLGLWFGLALADNLNIPAFMTIPIGLFVSFIVFAVTQKPMRQRERDWKFALERFVQRFEKVDEEEKKKVQEAGSVVFSVYYLGGYPNYRPSIEGDYGTLTVAEKHVAFSSTRYDRFGIKMARLKKVTVDSEASLIAKRVKHLRLRPITVEEMKTVKGRLKSEIRKRMKFVLFEYLDDLGEKLMIVFQPMAGNPLEAKSIKEAVDAQMLRYRQMKVKEEKKERAEKLKELEEAAKTEKKTKLSSREAPDSALVKSGVIPVFDVPVSPVVGPQLEPEVPVSPAAVYRASDLATTQKELKYDVVFLGGGKTEAEKSSVAERMALEFKITPDQAAAVIDRAPIIAKKALSYSDAEQLASSFMAIGAQVEIEATK